MSQHRQAFKKAFPYTIPVLTGYLFIGIAFGVMYAEKRDSIKHMSDIHHKCQKNDL